MKSSRQLQLIFGLLIDRYGPLSWWPAETSFEVCVGAILTQNTAWTNVEKAISALKLAGCLNIGGLHEIKVEHLAQLIRPAGYFNVKSRRLKDFVEWVCLHHGGSLERMFAGDWHVLREELLKVRGIGPETCDSMLLYAGDKPTFIVDAYTKRLFHRLGILTANSRYDETRKFFMTHLPNEAGIFNEYHALIVEQCKRFCRTKPLCGGCPLANECPVYLTGTR